MSAKSQRGLSGAVKETVRMKKKEFFKACLAGDINRVHELNSKMKGDFVNQTGSYDYSDDMTPLMAALCGNNQSVVDFLLNLDNVTLHNKDSSDMSALHYACVHEASEETVALIAKKMPKQLINDCSEDDYNHSALEDAVRTGNKGAVCSLILIPELHWDYERLQDVAR